MNKKKDKNSNKWNEESLFKKFFKENPLYVLGRKPSILKFEYPLFEATRYFIDNEDLLSYISEKRRIGSIDVVWGSIATLYITEIKYKNPRSQSDFWDALKVLGYTAYLKWINPKIAKKIVPTIFMPLDYIELQDIIVSNKLHITLFGIVKEKNKYKVKNTKNIPSGFWLRRKR